MKPKLVDFCDWQLKRQNNSHLWFSCPSGFIWDIATSISASVQNPPGVQELRVCNKVIKLSQAHVVVWIKHVFILQLLWNKLTFHPCNQSLENVSMVVWKVVSSNPSSCGHHGEDNRGPRFINFVISHYSFRTMCHCKRPDLLTVPRDESRRSYVMTAICSMRTSDHQYHAQAKLFHLCLYFKNKVGK